MSDDNPASAYREIIRRARKDHKCCECEGIIPARNYYRYASGIWDGRGESYKTCWPCVAFRNRARRLNLGWSGYDEPYFSQLFDGYPIEELPAHHPHYEGPSA